MRLQTNNDHARAKEAIAIIGTGCRFPGHANSPSKLWAILQNPSDLCVPMPKERFNAAGFYHENGSYHGHSNVKDMRSFLLSEARAERQFDSRFFSVNSNEANVMDPQVRLLLETTYEALEAAGQTIESLKDSDTGCYVGLMTGDYDQVMLRDEDNTGTYHCTGTARSLMSNRLSYFFDWHGPSMTIDTACSSSLVAVHQAVQLLRSGDSRVVVAAGSNLILDPGPFIAESKLQMLSPDGRSRMWDAEANGYARGEGVAAIVMKRLSDAEADGDHIECIIRETGVNQDGRTKGITVPSSTAQSNLIRNCYRRAGLDISKIADRPQYFEAHGTGTPTGDPIEAEAVSRAFFPDDQDGGERPATLLIGSIKTVIGHTEGTAGLAGILKASLALQNSLITPNLHFNRLNPSVEPHYDHLCVPTVAQPWPTVQDGNPRRASVNSFGFGGTNAHAILESYEGAVPVTPGTPGSDLPVFTPFVFSAASETSLAAQLSSFSDYLGVNGNRVNLRNLAYTLYSRRTRFHYSTAIAASSHEQLRARLNEKLEIARSDASKPVGTRQDFSKADREPVFLGIFTGQGTQWARMGAELIENSATARSLVESLEARLSLLPSQDRPRWSLIEELVKDTERSSIHEAMISQPLCTAIQICLVDLLRSAGIKLQAVVGHSSGEIGAAYAAGLISREDAICIAYYRGLHTDLASGFLGQRGAMMAVGTSFEDALDLCESPEFEGRVSIAAINSSSSVTLSGDEDAIAELQIIFDDEKKFARRLRVDKAYHSHHMLSCSEVYQSSLRAMEIKVEKPGDCTWFSSVYDGDLTDRHESMKDIYWERNMTSPVLFMQAIERACIVSGPFDLAIEIGPHPALKGPTLQTIQEISGRDVAYTSLLRRGISGIESVAEGLGYIWMHLDKKSVDLQAYDRFISTTAPPEQIKDLPTYPWDHTTEYWHETRTAKAIRSRRDSVHELLGHMTPDSTEDEMRWRHLLIPNEIPWLRGHKLQNQIVFPAAGHIVLALEASKALHDVFDTRLVEISNLDVKQGLTFDTEASGAETLFSLTNILRHGRQSITADFRYHASVGLHGGALRLIAGGSLEVMLGAPSPRTSPRRSTKPPNLMKVKTEEFYDSLQGLECQYSGPFYALSGLERKLGTARGTIANLESSEMLVHPAMLDAGFQSVLLTHSAPYDGQMWSILVPKTVRKVTINPYLCASDKARKKHLPFDSVQSGGESNLLGLLGDVDIYPVDSDYAMIQVEGLYCVPFAPATAQDDKALFSSMIWNDASPDAGKFGNRTNASGEQHELAYLLERVASFYLRKLASEVPGDHPARLEGNFVRFFDFAAHMASSMNSDGCQFWKSEWDLDTQATISAACLIGADDIDVKLLNAVGQNLVRIATGEITPVDVAMINDLLSQYYSNGLGVAETVANIAGVVKQLTHRYPRLNILEIGPGTSRTTESIIEQIGQSCSSYIYTDVSSDLLLKAAERFDTQTSKVKYEVLDIRKDPQPQDFCEHAYDLVVILGTTHTPPLHQEILRNIRRLLKPGGYLVVGEAMSNNLAWLVTILGAFPEWWIGATDSRELGPYVSLEKRDSLLRSTGFSGCDSVTHMEKPLVEPFSVWVTQAVDDRIAFLRNPLSSSPGFPHLGTLMQDLIIIGGQSSSTSEISSQLENLLREYCSASIRTAHSLAELTSMEVSSATTVLSLADVDGHLFQDITNVEFESAKRLLQETGTVLWVTTHRRAKNPHANIMIGLVRSALHEIPTVTFQSLDIEDIEHLKPRTIAEALLALKAGIMWQHQGANILTTVEPEVVIDPSGQMIIPRVISSWEMNDRYNSSRRSVTRKLDVQNRNIRIEFGSDSYLLREASKEKNSPGCLQVTHSLLFSIRLGAIGYAFVNLGYDLQTGVQKLSLAADQISTISPLATIELPTEIPAGSEPKFLTLVYLTIVALGTLKGLAPGDHLLVHDSDPIFAEILMEEAKDRDIDVSFTTTSSSNSWPGLIFIHPHAPDRHIHSLVPKSTTALLQCSVPYDDGHVAGRIASYLQAEFMAYKFDESFGRKAWLRPSPGPQVDSIHDLLAAALAQAHGSLSSSNLALEPNVVELNAIESLDGAEVLQRVIDWNRSSEVSVRLEPADSRLRFTKTKTYWLAGLTGGLGISLCEWMVAHGARYIVLTSRNPNLDPCWGEKMAAQGAVIKTYANDLTDKKQLVALHQMLVSTLPPIGGVAQGAMVLRDTSIHEMTLVDMMDVARPKVEGSVHLEEIFRDTDLEFFIFLSSVTAVIGAPGLSNYTGANLFMSSLAEQRRQRGLAASVIHIGPLFGVGYLAQEQMANKHYWASSAPMFMSEPDFRQQFAEAIVAGRPDSEASIEIVAGVRKVNMDVNPEHQPNWFTNPIMSHHILSGETTTMACKNTDSRVMVKTQLRDAISMDQVFYVVREAFVSKLCALFHLEVEQIGGGKANNLRLDEFGIDSLMAVEIRTWWIKTFGVNIPVLKLLSGVHVGEVIALGVENLDPDLMPHIASVPQSSLTTDVCPLRVQAMTTDSEIGGSQSSSEENRSETIITPVSTEPEEDSSPFSPLSLLSQGET